MEEINCWDKDLPHRDASRFSHFTCFSRTKVHILAPEELRASARTDALETLTLLRCFTAATSTKVPILTPTKNCVPGPMPSTLTLLRCFTAALLLLYCCYCSSTAALLLLLCCFTFFTFFTSTKVPILTPTKNCVPGPMR
jgi:hypothetical protein